jgi:hypothetical protein
MRKFVRAALFPIIVVASAAGATQQQPGQEFGAFLTGQLVADGKISDYVSGSTRTMQVKIKGEARGATLSLVEEMAYSDGEKRKFVWKFTKENGEYIGQRPDLIGKAKVAQNGDRVDIAYRANVVLPNGREQALDFVETLTFKGPGAAKLEIKVSKFFIPVAGAALDVKKLASAQ